MNAKEPPEAKHDAFGKKDLGPYEKALVCYFLDPNKAAYTYVTSTTGGRIAIEELKKVIRRERQLNGPNRYPLVEFTETWMDTDFGGRLRPAFKVVRFETIGAAAPAQPQQLAAEPEKPVPETPELKNKKPAPKKPNDDMDDDIPFE
jgi:hypothetical protein